MSAPTPPTVDLHMAVARAIGTRQGLTVLDAATLVQAKQAVTVFAAWLRQKAEGTRAAAASLTGEQLMVADAMAMAFDAAALDVERVAS